MSNRKININVEIQPYYTTINNVNLINIRPMNLTASGTTLNGEPYIYANSFVSNVTPNPPDSPIPYVIDGVTPYYQGVYAAQYGWIYEYTDNGNVIFSIDAYRNFAMIPYGNTGTLKYTEYDGFYYQYYGDGNTDFTWNITVDSLPNIQPIIGTIQNPIMTPDIIPPSSNPITMEQMMAEMIPSPDTPVDDTGGTDVLIPVQSMSDAPPAINPTPTPPEDVLIPVRTSSNPVRTNIQDFAVSAGSASTVTLAYRYVVGTLSDPLRRPPPVVYP